MSGGCIDAGDWIASEYGHSGLEGALVEVTQQDRDFAAGAFPAVSFVMQDAIRAGMHDESRPVQAFALYRLALSPNVQGAVAAERERCAAIAENRHEAWSNPDYDIASDVAVCQDIAAAIRASSPDREGGDG